MAKRIKSNSDYTDHPSVYQSMLISFTSLLLQGVSNEKQRRVNLAITDNRGIAAIRELCRTRHASRQAFSRNSSLSARSPPLRIRCEPTGGLSRRDKLAIAQCFSIGNALRRIIRVPEGRLLWSQAHSTGAGLSRPSGTQMLATGPLIPTLKCWAIVMRPFGTSALVAER